MKKIKKGRLEIIRESVRSLGEVLSQVRGGSQGTCWPPPEPPEPSEYLTCQSCQTCVTAPTLCTVVSNPCRSPQ